jgi:hypothetical protein
MGTGGLMEPIFESVKTTHDIYKATARIEARHELATELRQIAKPTKQVIDIIKRLESSNDSAN